MVKLTFRVGTAQPFRSKDLYPIVARLAKFANTMLVAGGQPFRVFLVDEIFRLDDRTVIRQRRITCLDFSCGRLFQPLEGSGI